MRTADGTIGVLIVGALAVICCVGPPLIAAIGVSALAALLIESVYVLIPALLIVLGVLGFWFYRRRARAVSCDAVYRKRGAKV